MLQSPQGYASITGREPPSIQVRVQDHRLSGPARNGAVLKDYISRTSTDGITVSQKYLCVIYFHTGTLLLDVLDTVVFANQNCSVHLYAYEISGCKLRTSGIPYPSNPDREIEFNSKMIVKGKAFREWLDSTFRDDPVKYVAHDETPAGDAGIIYFWNASRLLVFDDCVEFRGE